MSRRRRAVVRALGEQVRGWQVDQEMFDASVAELAGLHPTQWRCLDILTTRGPLTAGELAKASHLTTGAVTAVVDHLESAGLARRVRDADDRRRVIIEPTEEVLRRAEPIYGPFTRDSQKALRDFDQGQLEAITEFVRRQRDVLSRHTERAREMLNEARSARAEPARPAGEPVDQLRRKRK
jgi:DNA-binding MarR family transcriptional regulator